MPALRHSPCRCLIKKFPSLSSRPLLFLAHCCPASVLLLDVCFIDGLLNLLPSVDLYSSPSLSAFVLPHLQGKNIVFFQL